MYLPHTEQDISEMLDVIGAKSIDSLFDSIPKKFRIDEKSLDLPNGRPELEVKNLLEELAAKNKICIASKNFLGAGVYSHYIPAAVNHLAGRSEFYTAYTPYQPEISQGTLQALFEFQTMMCNLSDMDVSNASMYDGATALAEAVLMAFRALKTKRNKVLIPSALHPEYKAVLKTVLEPFNIKIVEIAFNSATAEIDLTSLNSNITDALAVVIQSPNFYGSIETASKEITALAKNNGALSIFACIEPVSLGLFESPAALGFDIAVMELQALGNPLSFGGPFAGVIAAKKDLIRNMPGRIIGETQDVDGKRAFVLTLATREQHIRREKATSNICSNEGLIALRTAIYLTLVGETGFKKLAESNYQNAHFLATLLGKKYKIKYNGLFFNEFVVEFASIKQREDFCANAKKRGFVPGLRIGEKDLLVAVTEQNSKERLEEFSL